jgi:hypothetical protein
MKEITLCGGRKCCPTLKIGDDITIVDDYGGKVTMTKEQAKILAEVIGKEV